MSSGMARQLSKMTAGRVYNLQMPGRKDYNPVHEQRRQRFPATKLLRLDPGKLQAVFCQL